MMRKLTATALTALAVAGLAGTGAAFASGTHATKPAASAVSREYVRDVGSRDGPHETAAAASAEGSKDASHDLHSSDTASHDSASLD
jgi:hypothetical protein